jgi:hypothetical protein
MFLRMRGVGAALEGDVLRAFTATVLDFPLKCVKYAQFQKKTAIRTFRKIPYSLSDGIKYQPVRAFLLLSNKKQQTQYAP